MADFDIAGLVRLGHLDPRDRHGAVAIGDALYRLGYRAVGVIPMLGEGEAVAAITLMKGEEIKQVVQKLD